MLGNRFIFATLSMDNHLASRSDAYLRLLVGLPRVWKHFLRRAVLAILVVIVVMSMPDILLAV